MVLPLTSDSPFLRNNDKTSLDDADSIIELCVAASLETAQDLLSSVSMLLSF
jgi:hypothetical protein